ncbi:hypothetical protein [Streptomyces sp. NPDC051677]|uniref:hypothetical protein n=1 Tax=Streptomyces sp. NPDC051677 TaxID=3365669 RepID=UPI0037D2D895
MTRAESLRLAAVEEQLAAVSRELRATRAHLKFLRALLAEEAPEVARAERDAAEIFEAIQKRPRPALQVLEGGRTGRHRDAHGDDRHGLHAV